MRPLSIGDVVLMVDEIQPREKWNLAVVVDFDRSEDGETRRYKLRTSNGQTFDRDIRKLVVLERGDDGEVIVLEGGGEESLSWYKEEESGVARRLFVFVMIIDCIICLVLALALLYRLFPNPREARLSIGYEKIVFACSSGRF